MIEKIIVAKFSTRDYVLTGIFAGATAVLSLVVGLTVIQTFGLGMGFITNPIIQGILISLAVFLVGKIGVGGLIWIIYYLIAVPTPALGPPGIIKFGAGLIVVASYELTLFLLKNKPTIGVPLAYSVSTIFVNLGVYFTFLIAGLPIERFLSILHIAITTSFITGFIGGLIGFGIYRKLRKKDIVKRLTR